MLVKRRMHQPTVAIAESHHEIADALEDVVALAGCVPVTVNSIEALQDMRSTAAAIVVRVATEMTDSSPHLVLQELALSTRPLVVALTSSDADVAEAQRLHCEVVLRAPHQVQGLYETLQDLAST
jgi:DNA-binding NtrC family response regulator